MNKELLVSIIIPNYNSEKFIRETILSVKNQTYKNWECIFVDDDSNDNSFKIIKKETADDLRFKLFERPEKLKKGGNTCRNYGFEKAQGVFINWFDSDDVMHQNFIKKKIECFIKQDSIDFVVSGGDFVNEKLKFIKKMPVYATDNLYKEYFFWRIKIVTNSVMFKKSFLNVNSLFNLNLTKGQEFELFTRLFYNNINYKIINESLFSYRSHPNSISSKNINYIPENKFSETFSIFQNLKRNLDTDVEITQSCYRLLITMYRTSLCNNDIKNVNYIEENLNKLNVSNKKLILKLLGTIKVMPLMFKKSAWNKLVYRIKIN